MPDVNPFLIVLLQNQLGVLLECSFDEVHGALRHWAVSWNAEHFSLDLF